DLAFSPLLPNQFGAGYPAAGADFDEIGCENVPIARVFSTSQPGAGYTGPPRGSAPHPLNLVFAANWINLRVPVPPKPADLDYLRLQGVTALVSGPDRWSTDGGPIFPRGERRRRGERDSGNRGELERVNGFARQGTAYIGPPREWRVMYQDDGNGTFRSDDGRVFNVTEKV
ncbi:MAG: hypothetical protein Q9216_004494, partial [Gyalolechia sp. 2 TL-2023]